MKLEEAEIFLMKIAQEYKTYGDLDNPEFEDIKKIPEAVETVLQESDKLKHDNYKLDKENQELFEKSINSIPKKKIKDLLNEIQEEYDLLLEHQSGKDSNRTKYLRGKIYLAQELLEDK